MWHRSQGKKYFEIEDELKEHFTFYTEEQIKEHMNKYVRLRSLNEAKKECIGEYKQLKEQKKQ